MVPTSKQENFAQRTRAFRKDAEQEKNLRKINDMLQPLENELIGQFDHPKLPLLFIIGPPRSGTTLLAQLLASSKAFSYITNFVARFWLAPYLGMMIERALGLKTEGYASTYSSKVGMTEGLLGPHEFGYFWKRWFKYDETHKLTNAELDNIDSEGLAKEVAALEAIYGLPLFFKNLVCGLQGKYLAEKFPSALFAVCKRDPFYNAQSLLLARKEVLGSENVWFSLRPKEYPKLKTLTPCEQVAAQIYFTLRDIETELEKSYGSRVIAVKYEELCSNPRGEIEKLAEFVSKSARPVKANLDLLPKRFDSQNIRRLGPADFDAIKSATRCFFPF